LSRLTCEFFSMCLIDWLIDRSIDWLIDWSVDRLIDWLTDQLIDWLIDQLISWSIDWLIDWSVDRLIDWLSCCRCCTWTVFGWCQRCCRKWSIWSLRRSFDFELHSRSWTSCLPAAERWKVRQWPPLICRLIVLMLCIWSQNRIDDPNRCALCCRFLSASLYVSKRGAYWDRLCRDVVGRWLVGRWLVGCHARVHCGQTVHPRPIVTMEH